MFKRQPWKLLINALQVALLTLATSWSLTAFSDPILAYLSDIEGSYEKLMRFFESHPAFEKNSEGRWVVRADATFVFGGDAVDRGNGNIRVVKELLRVKRESKGKTVFITGNRDDNKTRIVSEMSAKEVSSEPQEKELWRKWLVDTNRIAANAPETEFEKFNTPEQRLQFIFEKTMGAPKAFEFFRSEIAELTARNPVEVSDREVVSRVVDFYSPKGEFGEFLRLGQKAYRAGNTIFLHSGIPEPALYFTPGKDTRANNLQQWFAELNEFHTATIAEWEKSGENRPGPLVNLINEYARATPGSTNNDRSTVYGRTADEFNNPFMIPETVEKELMRQGVTRIVNGHTPIGQTAFVLHTQSGFEMVWCDNSFSPTENFPFVLKLTGKNFADLEIESRIIDPSVPEGRVVIRSTSQTSPLLGRRLETGEVVLTSLPSGEFLLARIVKGFKPVYRTIAEEQLKKETLVDPYRPGNCAVGRIGAP